MTAVSRRLVVTAIGLMVFVATPPAFAHVGAGMGASFMAGAMHPLGGLDHLAAMVAIGLWSAINGGRRLWLWPAVFVAAMLAGACAALAGLAFPYVEPTIAASVVVLGLLAALAVKAPMWLGALFVAVFALAHGHAHGTEFSGTTAGLYMAGFALVTAALHGVGILAANVGTRIAGMMPARVAGAAAALVGVALVVR